MRQYKGNLPEIELKYKKGDFNKVAVRSSEDAYKVLRKLYDDDDIHIRESVIVLYLNRSNNTIGWLKLSTGGLVGTVIDVRLIMATALKSLATAVIVSHNHPSGNKNPSRQDIDITNQLRKAGEVLSISVLDHLIITDTEYYSMNDNNDIG